MRSLHLLRGAGSHIADSVAREVAHVLAFAGLLLELLESPVHELALSSEWVEEVAAEQVEQRGLTSVVVVEEVEWVLVGAIAVIVQRGQVASLQLVRWPDQWVSVLVVGWRLLLLLLVVGWCLLVCGRRHDIVGLRALIQVQLIGRRVVGRFVATLAHHERQ